MTPPPQGAAGSVSWFFMNYVDIHCHIMPYVDDGAATMEEALQLLTMEAEAGVTELCLTPHLRDNMFNSPDEKILYNFARLNQARQKAGIPVRLHLSREYFYDSRFKELLAARKVIPMGRKWFLLVEFSYNSPFSELADAAHRVKQAGFVPLFAHVERYHAIQQNPSKAAVLAEQGVRLQLNASGILGKDGHLMKKTCHTLLKERLIFAVASDTHDTVRRAPDLQKCGKYLEKKFGREYTEELMYTNPLSILI